MNLYTLLWAVPALAQSPTFTDFIEEPPIEEASFTAPAEWSDGVEQLPNIYNTSAIDANVAANGYRLANLTKTDSGLFGILTIRGKPKNIYGYDFSTLNLTVSYQAKERLNVRVQPLNLTSDVFILPDEIVPRPSVDEAFSIGDSDLLFEYESDNFGFAIVRKSTGEALFDTRGNPLVFENQFVQFNTSLPRGHVISGLGDVADSYEIPPGTVRTLKTTDHQTPVGKDMYGNYPVYYDQRYTTNTTHAVWWRTSAISEAVIGEESLTWRALSGILDLYFFGGPTPMDAIKQYVSAIGLPTFQQYWTLGYHHCRWGYESLDQMKEVQTNFENANIPVETYWNDLDYMDRYLDFTIGKPFDGLGDYVDDLHKSGHHYIPLLDAGIYVPGNHTNFYGNYSAYHEGHDSDLFIKNKDGDEYIGMVWPGFTVWPDWFHNKSQSYWSDQITDFHHDLAFDGIWLDMNEPSSYIVGSTTRDVVNNVSGPVNPAEPWGQHDIAFPRYINVSNASYAHANITHYPVVQPNLTNFSTTWEEAHNYKLPGKGNILHPPYAIEYYQANYDLQGHHMNPDAQHVNGFVEYDLEGVFAHMQTNATYHALLETKPNKRPFIISRSGFTGMGNWSAKWGGDNYADWPWQRLSIAQYFQISTVAGIPYFGSDACGFNGNTDMELCARWMQLASFFPFYRNHNSLGLIPQEPYIWADVAEATRKAIDIRYSLLPYYYTLLHEAHVTGTPFLRQFKWLFPTDKSLAHIDDQFFVGDSLLVTPVLEPNTSTVVGAFPNAGTSEVYYDWYTHERATFNGTHNHTLHAPLGHIPIHIRGGSVIPTQAPSATIRDSRKNPFGLLVALDKDSKADGQLYLDDGESVIVNSTLSVNFFAADNELTALPIGTFEVNEPLENITIMGVTDKPNTVKFANNTVKFDYKNETLFLTGLQNATSAGAWATQFTVSWK